MKTLILSIVLSLSFGLLSAQPELITFDNGKKMKFELFKQRSDKPIKWSGDIGISFNPIVGGEGEELLGSVFQQNGGATALDLRGHYNIIDDLELSLRAKIGINVSDEIPESAPSFFQIDALGAYSFFTRKHTRATRLVLKSELVAGGTLKYFKKLPIDRTFRLEALGGLKQFQTPLFFREGPSVDNPFNALNEPVYYIEGMEGLSAQLGLATRWTRRLLYALDDDVTAVTRDFRLYAMALLPISRSFTTSGETTEELLAEKEANMYDLGFSTGLELKVFNANEFFSTYRLGIARMPNVDNAQLMVTLGYSLGFGANTTKSFLK